MAKKKYTFEVELEEEIYEVLKKWDYCFEKNIEVLITENGKELIKALKGGENND